MIKVYTLEKKVQIIKRFSYPGALGPEMQNKKKKKKKKTKSKMDINQNKQTISQIEKH